MFTCFLKEKKSNSPFSASPLGKLLGLLDTQSISHNWLNTKVN